MLIKLMSARCLHLFKAGVEEELAYLLINIVNVNININILMSLVPVNI